jgi:hypothetical protein
MKRYMHLIVATLLVTLLAGCAATGPKFVALGQPQADKGTVYLYRSWASFAAMQPFSAYVDERDAGYLYNASYLVLQLDPGPHTLRVWPGLFAKSRELDIEVKAGENAFYQYAFTSNPLTNLFFVDAAIEQRDEAIALAALKALHLNEGTAAQAIAVSAAAR